MFSKQARSALPSSLKEEKLTIDSHSITIEKPGVMRLKFYDKIAETLLISSVKRKLGGIHRFANYVCKGFFQTHSNGLSRLEHSWFESLPDPEIVRKTFEDLGIFIELCLDNCS